MMNHRLLESYVEMIPINDSSHRLYFIEDHGIAVFSMSRGKKLQLTANKACTNIIVEA